MTGVRRAALVIAALIAAVLISTADRARAEAPLAGRKGRLDGDAPLPLVVSGADGMPVDEAQLHFRRGVQLYADGNPAGALLELRRAYALVPNYRALFDLGQVAYQCGDHAAAFGYLTRYLTEGADQLPEVRRHEVARDLAQLRARVGFLSIETKERALRVSIDGAEVGVTPLSAPIVANVGRRRIDVVANSGDRQTRTVELAAGEILSISFGPPVRSPPTSDGRRSASPRLGDLSVGRPEGHAAQGPLPVIEPPRAPPPAPAPPPSAVAPLSAPSLVPAAVPRPLHDRRERRTPWLTWTLAAVAAGGAAATGALAWSTSQSLRDKAASYPVRASDLQDVHDRERRYALASDGLLAGAVVLSAIALVLTLTRPSPSDVACLGAACAEAASSAANASSGRW